MVSSLRISLTVLSIGFALEGAVEVYSLMTAGAFWPATSLIFLLPALATLLGLLFLLVGKHQWDETHRHRVQTANTVFEASVLAAALAVVELATLSAFPAVGIPVWSQILFGGLVAGFVLGTFVTYGLLVFHLVHAPSKVALVAAMLWAWIVATLIGAAVAVELPSILGLIATRSLSFESLVAPVDYMLSFLFLSYFLLLGAYVDAHVTVARGRTRSPRPQPTRRDPSAPT